MVNNNNGRDNQSPAADRRSCERAITAELERRDEPEPPVDPPGLAFFETDLGAVELPATVDEVRNDE
ncbi:hypothetical protein [Halorientalis sp.]|uniref:hypothetical protein n=1 Tax=Halorientalis sp. TaxID=1931229 RepID=UPI00261A20BF|nr:hypothetical protein [Halorientalis sp.]